MIHILGLPALLVELSGLTPFALLAEVVGWTGVIFHTDWRTQHCNGTIMKNDGVPRALETLLAFTDIGGAVNLLTVSAACLVGASAASYMNDAHQVMVRKHKRMARLGALLDGGMTRT